MIVYFFPRYLFLFLEGLRWDLYSFGFSMFKPKGAIDLNVWVQDVSRLILMLLACTERGGFFMNSRTFIFMSLIPE